VRRLTIAIDFDDDLEKNNAWRGEKRTSDPIEKAVECIQDTVVIHSRRGGEDKNTIMAKVTAVREWAERSLRVEGPVDLEIHVRGDNPLSLSYIDDRKIRCPSHDNKKAFGLALMELGRALSGENTDV